MYKAKAYSAPGATSPVAHTVFRAAIPPKSDVKYHFSIDTASLKAE